MALSINAPNLQIPLEPLSQENFAPFGTVVENPVHAESLRDQAQPPPAAVSANQGTALKYVDVSHLTNFYNLAPSKKPAKAALNMFVCSPRKLRSRSKTPGLSVEPLGIQAQSEKKFFNVEILERHPFTSQTFIPMGVPTGQSRSQYLVIVAPTLPLSSPEMDSRPPPYPMPEPRQKRSIFDIFGHARPSPFTNEAALYPSTATDAYHKPKGSGMPDLSNMRAFLASGSQAVTYGAGTWHAPMVVLGSDSIDFVVVQFANGVGMEDCQEVELKPDGEGGEGVAVAIEASSSSAVLRAKL